MGMGAGISDLRTKPEDRTGTSGEGNISALAGMGFFAAMAGLWEPSTLRHLSTIGTLQ